ncbi:RluA family pseudouridine synthase [Paenibacillus oenotherae]|uniref:Pseudouridine synthase n=1 Tax=Paenibacillus oenotherae TaxID=1435645 RepID=A0ABS7D9Y9_9BACL|nr:RluA family pseudouridine synthase [Paenibacillus oenotherae]MBW7476578.1 RluA family pseudouridine synthase [Paenibacillus oenotherae]
MNKRRSAAGRQTNESKRMGSAPRPPARPQQRSGRQEGTGNRPDVKSFTVQEPGELLAFLIASLKHTGRNAIKSMLSRGQITVNGSVAKVYNYPLQPGHTVMVSKERIMEEEPMIGLAVLHEDEHIIVVKKESGLLSIASDKENELTAYRQLTAHVRKKDAKARIFVVHRLDRDTSGVMMFAKSEQVQQTLQNAWGDMVQERTYIALVEGAVKKETGTIKSWLKESSTLKMYSSPYPNDGQLAITHYKMLQANRNFTLLEVHLETGRKNQIRVHMEEIGHPVVGDKKYGAKSKAIGRLGLHASVLAFVHPVTEQLMRFEVPVPKTFLAPFREPAAT